MAKKTQVFILEDDEQTRLSLINRLEREARFEVCASAGTIGESVPLLKTQRPDVLLVDLQLPDGESFGLIAAHTERAPDVPVLVISVFGDEKRVVSAIEAGAQGYLLKDDAGEDLTDAIDQVLAGEAPISPAIARHLIRRFQVASTGGAPKETAPRQDVLSEREIEVLRLASKGLTYQETAKMLGVSVNTVGTYTRRVYQKLAVSSRAEALFEARQMGLMSVDE
ncbi:MAG: response regulator transcription factor [Pseudomonadota bacterium]